MSFEIRTKLIGKMPNIVAGSQNKMPKAIAMDKIANLVTVFNLNENFPSLKNKDLKSIYSIQDPRITAKHKDFDPKEIIEIMVLIRDDLQHRRTKNLPHEKYVGVVDENNLIHKNVVVEVSRDVAVRKATFFEKIVGKQPPLETLTEIFRAQVRAYADKVVLAYYLTKEKKYIEKENLVAEKPILYKLEYVGEEIKRGEVLNWKLQKTTLLDELSAEMQDLEAVCKFAVENGLRIKFEVV